MRMCVAGRASKRPSRKPRVHGPACLRHSPQRAPCPHRTARPPQFDSESVAGASVVMDSLGVGLGREEMVNVALTIKRLGEDPKAAAASVRFFGKFLGLYSDYYVFEVLYKKAPEVPDAAGEPQRLLAGRGGAQALKCSPS